jgi:uncharacterized protein (DUF2267 family)
MHPFEKLSQTANPWVESMMAELRVTDPYKAVRALGAGLATLRELMTPREMARFVGLLPVVVRGLFFEGWDPQVKPREIHHRSQLLALLGQKYAPHADLPTDLLLAAFLAVLNQRLRPEEMAEIARKLQPLTGDFGWAAMAAGATSRAQAGGPH